MTGGALTWTNATWPGAYFAPRGVRYVAVAGRAVRGDAAADRSTVPGYSYGAYQQVRERESVCVCVFRVGNLALLAACEGNKAAGSLLRQRQPPTRASWAS
jgi:hypothetical protein